MNILVFGAHPDDMEVGMGGSIARFSSKGHTVQMVLTTIPSNRAARLEEAKNAAEILGADLKILDINPENLIFSRALVRCFDEVIRMFNPDMLFTHWNHDSHQDHVAVANSVIAAARKNYCSLYMYEQTIPGGIVPYGFRTQSFIDISESIEVKIEGVCTHKSQLESNGDWWLYGVRGRAMYRGYQINVKYAEAFEVVKELKSID